MEQLSRRPVVSVAVALAAAAAVLVPLLSIAGGAVAPALGHWWCSPVALRSTAHALGANRVGPTVLAALEVHWPHFVPALAGLVTLIYLRPANIRQSVGRRSSLQS
jgi:hypothetical protein